MENIILENSTKELVQLFSNKVWRQRIHLLDNIYTPGTRSDYEWDMCFMPPNLNGQSFLDVGANDGMFSFLAEMKGAKKVTSVDIYIDNQSSSLNMTQGWHVGRIENIKKIRHSAIDIKSLSIYELSKLNEKFDVVYCGNVLAWLENQTEALNQLAQVTKTTLILRDDVSRIKGKPALEYVNNDNLSGCMFNANKEFYINYFTSLGFKSVTFKLVDEFSIYKKRNTDFPKYEIIPSSKLYINPFDDQITGTIENKKVEQASAQINNRYFFNHLGWISSEDVIKLNVQAIPKNKLKHWLFKQKFKKTSKDNYIIIAHKH